jgi:hypothetical protein
MSAVIIPAILGTDRYIATIFTMSSNETRAFAV